MQEAQRKYNSPLREQQASDTRERILESAKKVLVENGYARTTIDAIAKEAVVSPQTIYASFKNKRNIFSELIQRNIESDVDELCKKSVHVEGIRERIDALADIIIRCNARLSAENAILRSTGILSPELAEIHKVCEERGRNIQREYNRRILRGAKLTEGLTLDKALDIFWYLTRHDAYKIFVTECGWPLEDYRKWLRASLMSLLEA